jgi:DNA-binding IclR family transcriptional regulator
MTVTTAPSAGTQSVDRTIHLLKLVAIGSKAGIGLSEAVASCGLNKATTRRLLLALARGGLVEQDPVTKRYHLGPESYVVGTLAADRFGIHRVAQDGLARLARTSGDTAFLSVRRDVMVVCLHREEGPYPIRTHVLLPGSRHPLGVGGAGLALLAALDDSGVDAVIAANADVWPDYPLISAERLKELVTEARQRGFALNPGLIMPDSWGIGVAVRDGSGEPVAALSLAAIASRMKPARQDELGALLIEEAHRLEAQLRGLSGARGGQPATRVAGQDDLTKARGLAR